MTHDTTKYEHALRDSLKEVTAELGTLGIHNPNNPQDWIATPEAAGGEADPNVVADTVEDWEERRATLSTLERRYNDLNRALAKIADGTYGICEIAGETIEAERLEANPAARTCMQHLEEEGSLPI